MVRLLVPLLALTLSAGDSRAADPPKADAAKPTRALLDLLLQRYKLYELPFPPADAPLVRVEGWRSETDGMRIQRYYLGFHIPGTKAGDRGRVFLGTKPLWEPGRREVPKPVGPRPESLQ